MNRTKLDISTDNAAFEDEYLRREVARILRALADKVASGAMNLGEPVNVRDINGNTVGTFTLG